MTDALHVASRKGLFTFRKTNGAWLAGPPAFLGEPVTAVLTDARDGAIYAALRLGHFGCKLHRSDDRGESWQELPAPAYPPAPEDAEAPALDMIWALAAGSLDAPGELWAGTLPGASSAAPTAAPAGPSSTRSGPGPSAASGSAAATTTQASTRSSSTRATRTG